MKIDCDEVLQRLYRRFLWLDDRLEDYLDDEAATIKLLNSWTRVALALRDFMKMRGVEAEEHDLSTLLSKLPMKITKRVRRWLKAGV